MVERPKRGGEVLRQDADARFHLLFAQTSAHQQHTCLGITDTCQAATQIACVAVRIDVEGLCHSREAALTWRCGRGRIAAGQVTTEGPTVIRGTVCFQIIFTLDPGSPYLTGGGKRDIIASHQRDTR